MGATWVRGSRLAALVGVMGLTLGLAGCSSSDDDGGSAEDGPIVIGAAIGETGLLEAYDLPYLAAVEQTLAQVNADGGIDGRQVELEVLDTKSDIKRGGQVAQQLIDDGADVLLVSSDFDFGSPAAAAAQKAGVVAITLGASSPKFGVQAIGDKAFSFSPSTGNSGSALATFAKEQGFGSAYTLLDDSLSFTRGLNAAFTTFFERGGGTIVGSDSFKNDDSSIAVQINQIKAAAPDVLFLASYPPGGAAALRQIRAAGIDVPILSGDAFDGTAWVDAVPGLSDFYVTSAASVFGDDADPDVNAWFAQFAKDNGAPATKGNAAVGNTIVRALELAIEKAGTTEGDALSDALESFDGQEFLTGTVTFSPEVHIPLDSPIRIIRFTDGTPAYVETVTPEFPAAITDGIG